MINEIKSWIWKDKALAKIMKEKRKKEGSNKQNPKIILQLDKGIVTIKQSMKAWLVQMWDHQIQNH